MNKPYCNRREFDEGVFFGTTNILWFLPVFVLCALVAGLLFFGVAYGMDRAYSPYVPVAVPTSTPAVTATPSPTSAPTRSPYLYMVSVTAQKLNVRSCPSRGCQSLYLVGLGDIFMVLEESDNGWLRITERGWVYGCYTKKFMR